MSFWRNPEFVRHARAELRPGRALSAAGLALVICSLVGLSCWGSTKADPHRELFRVFYLWLMGIQYVVLLFWCASACGHSIARERELKTYDFLRTTRLTAWELVVGKALGVPVLAYFTVGCTLPVAILLGILAQYPLHVLFWTYALLLVASLFVSVMSLWASMQLEGSSARSVGLLAIIPLAFGFSFAEWVFPGFGAISVFPGLFSLYGEKTAFTSVVPTLFAQPVSFVVLSLLLYILLGAWFVLMLIRNIKKDTAQIRLLSRWQAVGFAGFINLLFFAFLDPHRIPSTAQMFGTAGAGSMSAAAIAAVLMSLNGFLLLVIGIAMLSPQEKLRVWWRRHAAGEEPYLSEAGPPWPWLIPAATVAYVLLAMEALGQTVNIPLGDWKLGAAALELLVFLVFTTRDVLLQWAILTRMKRPVVKGMLYLWLYYSAAGIVAAVFGIISQSNAQFLLGLLTPWGTFRSFESQAVISAGVYAGVVLQLLVIALLLRVTSVRLGRPAIIPALSEG